jgi:hypothetical protein
VDREDVFGSIDGYESASQIVITHSQHACIPCEAPDGDVTWQERDS